MNSWKNGLVVAVLLAIAANVFQLDFMAYISLGMCAILFVTGIFIITRDLIDRYKR